VALASQAGFKVVKALYFDIAGIIPWYINFVLLKNLMGGVSVSFYDKIVVPITQVIESFLPPPIGKNLLLVAKKLNLLANKLQAVMLHSAVHASATYRRR
jgi:hypothetical protein